MKISIRGANRNNLPEGMIGIIPVVDYEGYIECEGEVTPHDYFAQKINIDEMISFTKFYGTKMTRFSKKVDRIHRIMKLKLYKRKPKPIVFDEEDDLPF